MEAISIFREEPSSGGESRFHAISKNGGAHSVGRTPGEALDALTSQLPEEEASTLVTVQTMRPDAYFNAAQVARLADLTERAQTVGLTDREVTELESLVEDELLASTRRASDLADALGL